MKRHIVVLAALMIAIMLLPGCTSIKVERPDTVTVTVQTLGSTQITSMIYERNADGVLIKVGEYVNTPAGIPETVESIGSAITDVATAGVSSAVETAIKADATPEKPD